MLRALVWKEWKQLALVRWGGVALGALLPAAFILGAELAKRGLLPTGTVRSYAPRDVMFELLPAALAFGPWPLVALMAAAQSFAGDRAAGTEVFLLERPVPRSVIWCARGIASFGTLVMVIVMTGAVAAVCAASTGAPPNVGWLRWLGLCGIGIGTAILAFVGSTIASSLLSSPMGSVLLGGVLGAVPALLAAELMTFTYARFGEVPLGAVLPAILVPGYLAASFWALCRGEPAGRGRIRRAASILLSALGGILLLFAILAPIGMRANAMRGEHAVYAFRSGSTAYLAAGPATGWGGGFLVDPRTGARRAFIPPPVREVQPSPDGAQVAFVTWSAPFGGERSHERIEIRSSADGSWARTIAVPEDVMIGGLAWTDAGMVTVAHRILEDKHWEFEIEVINPIAGTWRSTGFRATGWNPALVRADAGRHVYARETIEVSVPEGGTRPYGYRLYPIDVAACRVGPAMPGPDGQPLVFEGWAGGLSPSGRYASVVVGDQHDAARRIVDLRTGTFTENTASRWGQWTASDALIWQDRLGETVRLFVMHPGGQTKALREWRDVDLGVRLSPDRRAAFISVIPISSPVEDATRLRPPASLFEAPAPRGNAPEELVYFPEEDRFASLGPAFSDRGGDRRYSEWAGDRMLARIAPGVVALESIDTPGVRRFAIGGPSDLE